MTRQAAAPPRPKIAILGAGISGLAAAHRLFELSRDRAQPVSISLLERSDRPGGVIRSERRDGFVIDHGPDSMLSDKPPGVGLCERLGITGRLQRTREEFRRTYVAFDGRLHPLPEGFLLMAPTRLSPLATSGLFTLSGKLRMALDLVLPSRPRDDESLASFVTRRLGREALDRVAQPMVGGIYTADPETLSLAATMPRFLDLEKDHGSIIRGLRAQSRTSAATQSASGARWSLFLGFDRGMETLVEEICGRLPSGTLQLGRTVESLVAADAGWRIDGEAFDAVIVALPAPVAGRILRGTDAALAADLEGIAYASSAVVNLGYRRESIPNPLDGFGFVVPHVEGRRIIACSFNSMKYAGRAPSGHALLRAFVGGALRASMLERSDEEIFAAVREELRDLLSIGDPPELQTITRYPSSMPQYQLGHLARVERIESRSAAHQRLALAGNGYRGVGIPDCIDSGERAAEKIFSTLESSRITDAA